MKKQLTQLAQTLYPTSLIEVVSYRGKKRGGKKPPFIVQVNVDGLCLTTAMDRVPKTAYKTAGIQLSKGTVK
jgi:hypothetical protein